MRFGSERWPAPGLGTLACASARCRGTCLCDDRWRALPCMRLLCARSAQAGTAQPGRNASLGAHARVQRSCWLQGGACLANEATQRSRGARVSVVLASVCNAALTLLPRALGVQRKSSEQSRQLAAQYGFTRETHHFRPHVFAGARFARATLFFYLIKFKN